MTSIYIYNRTRGKCVQLCCPEIADQDIEKLQASLPRTLEGLSFSALPSDLDRETLPHLRIEDSQSRVAEYLKGIGKKLEQLHQESGALSFYDLSFRLKPKSDVLIMRANVLRQLGHADKAERLLRHYLSKQPNSAEAYYLLGKISLNRHDYFTAGEHFTEALRIAKQSANHERLCHTLKIHQRFIMIYQDRDHLFTRNLPQKKCIEEVKRLQSETDQLIEEIKANLTTETEGMVFFLENHQETFNKWLELMQA